MLSHGSIDNENQVMSSCFRLDVPHSVSFETISIERINSVMQYQKSNNSQYQKSKIPDDSGIFFI